MANRPPNRLHGQRLARQSEIRYAQLLSKVTTLSLSDAMFAVGVYGLRARRAWEYIEATGRSIRDGDGAEFPEMFPEKPGDAQSSGVYN